MVIRKCNDNIREELEGTDIAALKKCCQEELLDY